MPLPVGRLTMPERTRRASHPPNWPRHRTRDRAPSFQCPPRRTTVTACCRFGAAYGLARVGIPLSACARPHRRKPPHVPVPRRTLPGVGQSIPFLRDSERRGAADRSQCVRPGKRGLGAAVWEHGWRWIGCAGQCDSECTQARCTHVESRTGALVICYSLPSERRGRSTGSRGSGHAASHTHAFDGEHWALSGRDCHRVGLSVSGARCHRGIRYVKRPQSHWPEGMEEGRRKDTNSNERWTETKRWERPPAARGEKRGVSVARLATASEARHRAGTTDSEPPFPAAAPIPFRVRLTVRRSWRWRCTGRTGADGRTGLGAGQMTRSCAIRA